MVWVARYRGKDGKRGIAKPRWNQGKGTFSLRRDAQLAIDEALDAEYGQTTLTPESVGAYSATWSLRHPRGARTNATNDHRVGRVLEVNLEGKPLKDWIFSELRRRHAVTIVDVLLADQGRAALGAQGIIRALSAMTEDAIADEVAETNPFKGLRIKASDIRVTKAPRATRVWSFGEMHAFAAAAGKYEALIRTFADTGMRLGEVLPLRRQDLRGDEFFVRRTAHEGLILEGTKIDHGIAGAGRTVPCPPGLARLLRHGSTRIDTDLLFSTPTGLLWRERNFYRDVWYPAQERSGLDIRPHEMRHSYISHMRARGIDDADLAAVAGHSVNTMLSRYTHPLKQSHEEIRKAIG